MESGLADEAAQPVATAEMVAEDEIPEQLTEVETLGADAFRLRVSPEYLEAKRNRPRQGETWDFLIWEIPEEEGAAAEDMGSSREGYGSSSTDQCLP